jgi:hypothetical protein
VTTNTILRVRQPEAGKAMAPAAPLPEGVMGRVTGGVLPEEVEEDLGITGSIQTPPSTVQATPNLVHVGTLLDDRLRIKGPIDAEIETEGDFYIAKCEYVIEFGYGQSPMEAIDDLRLTLAELYHVLSQERERLAPGMAETWERLREVIEER